MSTPETGWPRMIYGVEDEYTRQPLLTKGEIITALDAAMPSYDPGAVVAPRRNGYFLSNGGSITPEVEATVRRGPGDEFGIAPGELEELALAEYSTPEADSAEWAIAARERGAAVVSELLGGDGVAIYCRTGYANLLSGNTSTGHHESYLGRGAAALPPDQRLGFADTGHLGSFLSTRHVIGGAGMVGEEYLLGQKVPYISSTTNELELNIKVLLRIPRRPYAAAGGLYRIEYRGGDGLISRLAQQIALGTTAAFATALRLADHRDRLTQKLMYDLTLFDPMQGMKITNNLRGLHWPLPTLNGGTITAVGVQEAGMDLVERVAELKGYELPADQRRAIDRGRLVYDALRRVRSIDDIGEVSRYLEWAGKLAEMQRAGVGPITRTNARAVAFDLRWHDINDGPGREYWAGNAEDQAVVPDEMTEHCQIAPPPGTRAAQRVALAKRLRTRGVQNLTANWDQLASGNPSAPSETWQLPDPFGRTRPIYKKRRRGF